MEDLRDSDVNRMAYYIRTENRVVRMEVISKLIGAVAPGVCLLAYFYLKDQLKPEPFKLVIKVFIIGGLVVFPLIVVQSILAPYNGGIWIESFLLSGLFEEFIKWFLLYFLIYNHTEFDEFFDGIVYAVAIAAGFATVENLFYVILGNGNEFSVIWTRALLPVSGHVLFGVTMGYYFAKMKNNPKIRYYILSILLPACFHGVFNLMNHLEMPFGRVLLITFMSFLWWFNIRKMNLSIGKGAVSLAEK